MSDVFSFEGFIGRTSYWRLTGICALAFITAYFSIILSPVLPCAVHPGDRSDGTPNGQRDVLD